MPVVKRLVQSPLFGLIAVNLALFIAIASFAPHVRDRATGAMVNGFLKPDTLMQLATDTSFFAILAIGMSMVMLSGGIDLSVGSIYALSGVLSAMALQAMGAATWAPPLAIATGFGLCLGIGAIAGMLNGALVVSLGVHPFVVTVGAMWALRGVAFVVSKAQSVNVPTALTEATKSTLGLPKGLYPVPMLVALVTCVVASLFLHKTIAGRNVYAVGGNSEAAYCAGIRIPRALIGAYTFCGVAAALSAYMGATYYGASNSADAQGYELYAIASAVVGGVSLNGGRGSAVGAALGALLIAMMRQAISTLNLNSNYEYIIIGVALVAAVFLDQFSQRRSRS